LSAPTRKYFGVEAVSEVLDQLGNNLEKPVTAILVGGGAMSLKGDKEATKDVDMVVMNQAEKKELIETAKRLGFTDQSNAFPTYTELAATVLVDQKGFQIDLFQETIARKFKIHQDVLERAEVFDDFSLLEIYLLADEDLFLSKSVTERDLDLADMHVLYLKGLDEDTIIQEAGIQDLFSEIVWEAFLNQKLIELEQYAQLTIPWRKRVEEIALLKMEGRS